MAEWLMVRVFFLFLLVSLDWAQTQSVTLPVRRFNNGSQIAYRSSALPVTNLVPVLDATFDVHVVHQAVLLDT